MLRQSSLAVMAKAPCVVTTQYLLIKEDCKSLSRAKLFAEVAATLAVNPGSSGDRAPSQQTNEHVQGCRKLPNNAEYKARIAATLDIRSKVRDQLIREYTQPESQTEVFEEPSCADASQEDDWETPSEKKRPLRRNWWTRQRVSERLITYKSLFRAIFTRSARNDPTIRRMIEAPPPNRRH